MTETHLLTPWVIRGLTLHNRILQAPLAGYSNMPFRLMCWQYGRPGMLATEMISAQALVRGCKHNEYYLLRHEEEGPLQYQLWGTDPEALAEAARICTGRGAAAIDLNCGCPVRKVNASGSGVTMMRDPALIARCIAAMRQAVDLPLSAKLRVGPMPDNFNAVEIARGVVEAGADFITIHGRHGKEAYNTPARLAEIARVVEAVAIPVIGNGDVCDGKSALRMEAETGCAGVMVGRGCMGNPWVFDRISTEISGKAWTEPSREARGEVLLKNFRMLVKLIGAERATRHIRKLASFYSKGLQGSREFRMGLNFCHTPQEFEAHAARHFGL
ncbi:MAG: tRNA dihydrouridine synthase DusB [Planctomycetes bacterium]|nr:tRNA dihydrouridine synthase DusB [Planctomycetota bacterium]